MSRLSLPSLCLLGLLFSGLRADTTPPAGPYDRQIAELLAELADGNSQQRARAVESLGYLRAYAAEDALIGRLSDTSARVRREAALALGWCGGRGSVAPLLAALRDPDWLTRQAAHVALTNLTGMEFPFDALAAPDQRERQVERWSSWWSEVPADRPPQDVLDLLGEIPNREPIAAAGNAVPRRGIARARVAASTTYKGPPSILTDGYIGPEYWQTKNVAPPQSCTLDLGLPTEVSRVIVHQYGEAFVMIGCELAVSRDGEAYEVVERRDEPTPVKLVFEFPKRSARYVRVTSFGAKNPTYPTTFFEVEINQETAIRRVTPPSKKKPDYSAYWRKERGLRALGALGGQGATDAILAVLGPNPGTSPDSRLMVRAGIRALGRLRDEAGLPYLLALLDDPFWARCAAEALGDFGDQWAVGQLIAAYPRFAKNVQGQNPSDVPRDDKMGFPSEDRMLETPFWIAYSLCRLPLDDLCDGATLRRIAPLIMANLPGDHDTFILYEPEVGHWLTLHLMKHAGLRQEACEQAFLQLGQPRRVPPPGDAENRVWSKFPPARIASWLPCVCTRSEDVPRLLALLQHPEGWVRLNAAKTLAWIGDPGAVDPIAQVLRNAKSEAEFGYSGTFKDEEYDDPAPRWREGPIRALGILGAHQHTDLIVSILDDEGSVVEIRHAAAKALGDLGNDRAIAALQRAVVGHPFAIVRNAARDALREHGRDGDVAKELDMPKGSEVFFGQSVSGANVGLPEKDSRPLSSDNIPALVFIKGDNSIPNTIGTVEQADRWRQTYVVTDSGPVYRPGRNLYLLRPPKPDGKVTAITQFDDGYVGEPEMSWDGGHVLFTRRGQDDPWWQIWRVNIDGSQLAQITGGPYHHVGPCYLPDGRIVFASSRSGLRDEYHGYPCTSLHVMNADGSDLHQIATNIGRDNEPAILPDGRIVFSRLEVFYSRNKTELTLHAARPDGTQDVVLYGPERRAFWRDLDHGPRSPADGQEAPLTHRVLRMTQPQAMTGNRNILVTTQGGLTEIGSRRDTERIISPENKTRSYTTPWPLPDGKILCASTPKTPDRKQVDLGLYFFDPETGALDLLYNDPSSADFEPRPVAPRPRPPVLVDHVRREDYSGRFVCSSVFNTREKEVLARGRLVRLIEGMPIVGRHSTHTNEHPVWKNHGGTLARVLGTIPLAPDGSFHVEAPADRLMHFQVLDSDRRVVGQQLTWIYPRPGETKSCVGCHEDPHSASAGNDPLASHFDPVNFTPGGREFRYRAKAWFKGHLPDDIEERTRTVRAVNLLGRR